MAYPRGAAGRVRLPAVAIETAVAIRRVGNAAGRHQPT
jgi:hypothetical protein